MKRSFLLILIISFVILNSVKFDWGHMNFLGQIQFRLEEGNVNSFDLKRLRMAVNGTVIPDRLSMVFQLEFRTQGLTITESDIDNIGDAPISKTSDINLLDLYGAFDLDPFFINIGRFIIPIDHYSPQSAAKLNLIEYPLLVTNYTPWRQIGMLVNFKTSIIDIKASVTNGNGPNSFQDIDSEKAYFARLDIRASKTFVIGSSVYTENIYHKESKIHLTNDIFSVFFWIKEKNFFFVSQLNYVEKDIFTTERERNYNYGYFLHLSAFLDSFELATRYEFNDTRSNIPGDINTRLSLGINYNFSKSSVLSVNYLINGSSHKENDDMLLFQLQLSI